MGDAETLSNPSATRMALQSAYATWQHLPHGLVVRISGFHPGGPGSIPGAGNLGLIAGFMTHLITRYKPPKFCKHGVGDIAQW